MRVRLIFRVQGDAPREDSPRERPSIAALFSSAMLHVAVLALAFFGSSPFVPQPEVKTIYEQVIAPEENKIVWYHLRQIPRIDPTEKIGATPDPQGLEKSKDVLISVAPEATPAEQLVLRAALTNPPVKEKPSPDPSPIDSQPPSPKKKIFGPPPSAPPAEIPSPEIPVRPENPADPRPVVPKRAFVPPPVSGAVAPIRKTTADLLPPSPDPSPGNLVAALLDNALNTIVNRLPNKPFVAPGGQVRTPHSSPVFSVPEPTVASAGETSSSILGSSPLQKILGGLPDGRPPEASRAPTLGPTSSGDASRNTPRVPGLAIQPANKEIVGVPNLPVNEKPVYEETRVAAVRSTLSVPLRPSSRTIPQLIESKFAGRVVYSMIIPAPQLPIYAGDWIMWFAEKEAKPGLAPQIRAPLPRRKFGKASDGLELHPSGRVQFSATLLKSGQLVAVNLMTKPGTPSNQAAVADLERWQFAPALRDGEAVDVDIILEIPFQ